jgi:hypothetical protein
MSELYPDVSDDEDTPVRLVYNVSDLAHMHIAAENDVRIYVGKQWEFLRSLIPQTWSLINTNHIQDCEYHLHENPSTLFFIDYQIPGLHTCIQSYLDRAKN